MEFTHILCVRFAKLMHGENISQFVNNTICCSINFEGKRFVLKQIIPEIYIQNAREAIALYREIFGGEIKNLQLSDDLEMFRDMKGKVIHSELHVNKSCVLYFVDAYEPRRSQVGNVTVMLHMDSEEQLHTAFERLSRDGQVGMEPQKTFLGATHAIVTDRFGAPWALNYAKR